jgi:hypothetical protein
MRTQSLCMKRRIAKRHRRGAAILLAMLAAAIVATAAIAILQAGKRQSNLTRSKEDAMHGDCESRGLVELAIATLRKNPAYLGEVRDKNQKSSKAFAIVNPVDPSHIGINVYLYQGSLVPAQSIQIDRSLLKR